MAQPGPFPAEARAARDRPGTRSAGDRDPGATRRGTLHLLPVLKEGEHVSESRGHGEVASAAVPEPAATALYGRRPDARRSGARGPPRLSLWDAPVRTDLETGSGGVAGRTRRTLSLAILHRGERLDLDQLAATTRARRRPRRGQVGRRVRSPPDDIPVAPPDEPGDPDDGAGDGGENEPPRPDAGAAPRGDRRRLCSPAASVTSPSACSGAAGDRLGTRQDLDGTHAQLAVHDAPDRQPVRSGPGDRDARGERPPIAQDVHGDREALIGTAGWPSAYRDGSSP